MTWAYEGGDPGRRALEESHRKGAVHQSNKPRSGDSHPCTGQKKNKTPLELENILAPLAQLAKDPQTTHPT